MPNSILLFHLRNASDAIEILIRLTLIVFATIISLGILFVPYRYFAHHGIIVSLAFLLLIACIIVNFHYGKTKNWLNIDTNHSALINILIILCGIAIRAAWIAVGDFQQTSDFASYFAAAERISEEGQYYFPFGDYEFRAWRPPGLPIIIAVFLYLGMSASATLFLINILFYMITVISLISIGHDFCFPIRAINIILITFSFWPTFIIFSGFFNTEIPSAALLTGFVALAVRIGHTHAWAYAILGGLLLGALILTRPASVLVIGILALVVMIQLIRRSRPLAGRYALTILVATLTVAPWTIRNYIIFDSFVLVSTNGGDVLYRANNELATGDYTERGMIDLSGLRHDEIAWNKKSAGLAKEWMLNNPISFGVLILKKQAILLGEGFRSDPIRRSIEDRFGKKSARLIGGAANVAWVLALPFVIVGLWNSLFRRPADLSVLIVVLVSLHVIAAHSIFESQPRHHLPLLPSLWVLAMYGFVRKGEWTQTVYGEGREESPAARGVR
jgi:4-amino-4-deoxy-L-arabinose transferase-like glycosyltransferase